MTDLLTTPQSGGQVPRIGHGSSTEQPQELPASQRDQADADTMQLNERMAQTVHSAWKQKEFPTAAEQCHNRSRHTESTQTTPEVQASWETYSQHTIVNQPHRPIMTSGWIQHQGQPRDRILMAHGKGSTGYYNDVLDAGKMAASLQKVPTTALPMNTSRRAKGKEGGRWNTESATQARRERRNRWHRVNGPGPPLHPEGDGTLCTGVVLPKAT